MRFSITPKEVLDQKNVKYKVHGSFLSVFICPECEGGSSGAKYTFGVHSVDGNYFCLRVTCGFKGSFWSLLEYYNLDPKAYILRGKENTKPKKKGFIYGK